MSKRKSGETNESSHTHTPGEQKKERSREGYDVSPEAFIEAWQTSDTAEEVAEKLKMPKPIVHARASNYRLAGIKLKKMSRRPKNRLDVDALNRKIEEINAKLKQGK